MRDRQKHWKSRAGLAAAFIVAFAQASGQECSENSGRRRIVVSIPDRRLALMEDGRVLRVYPVAVGAPATPSPTGSYQVVERIPNPTWYQPGKIVPPGKSNPLGTRWLGLDRKGYGIHGTNNPRSIGRPVSHGCIRMRNSDVEQLFNQVRVGDLVEFRGNRDEEVRQIFHPAPVTAASAAGQ